MKLKKGHKWKSIDGLSKGKFFKITGITSDNVTYKSEESGHVYIVERKHFEKYMERVKNYWKERVKSYKDKKDRFR